MVLHTIISPEDVLCDNKQQDIVERKVDGGMLSLVNINGEYRPYRLFSTNPALYLDPRYQNTRFYF